MFHQPWPKIADYEQNNSRPVLERKFILFDSFETTQSVKLEKGGSRIKEPLHLTRLTSDSAGEDAGRRHEQIFVRCIGCDTAVRNRAVRFLPNASWTRWSRTPRHLEQNRISLRFALVSSVVYYGLTRSRTPRYFELFFVCAVFMKRST